VFDAARLRLGRLLTWRRARTYAFLLVALYVIAWIDVLLLGTPPLNSGGAPMSGDYIAFQTAARLIVSGRAAQMYDHATVAEVQGTLLGGAIPGFYDAYRNPPFFALIYTPLASLDLIPAFGVWFGLSLACLGLSLKLLLDEVPALRRRWRGLLIFVLAFAPVYFGLIDGENAALSLLLYVLIYRSFRRGQDLALGVWAALGLFKPQLFFIFPLVFLITRRWRALVAYVVTALALLGVSIALVGTDGLQAWARIILEPEGGNALANGWRMASAKALFDSLLPGLGGVSLAAYLAVAVALLAGLSHVWRRPSVNLPVAFALTCLVTVLIDPHLVDYDLSVLVAAGVVASSLVPRYALAILPLYLVTILRAQIPIGDAAALQITAPILLALTGLLYWQTRHVAAESQGVLEPDGDRPGSRPQVEIPVAMGAGTDAPVGVAQGRVRVGRLDGRHID
jgi:hypothetical protein